MEEQNEVTQHNREDCLKNQEYGKGYIYIWMNEYKCPKSQYLTGLAPWGAVWGRLVPYKETRDSGPFFILSSPDLSNKHLIPLFAFQQFCSASRSPQVFKQQDWMSVHPFLSKLIISGIRRSNGKMTQGKPEQGPSKLYEQRCHTVRD